MAANPSSGQVTRDDGTVAPVKRFFKRTENAQEEQLVAAVTGRKIRVLSLFVTTDANTGTVVIGYGVDAMVPMDALRNLDALSGYVLPHHPGGHYETLAGFPLTWSTGTGGEVSISGTYAEI